MFFQDQADAKQSTTPRIKQKARKSCHAPPNSPMRAKQPAQAVAVAIAVAVAEAKHPAQEAIAVAKQPEVSAFPRVLSAFGLRIYDWDYMCEALTYYGADVYVNGTPRELIDDEWIIGINRSIIVCHFKNHTREERSQELEADFTDTCTVVDLTRVYFAYSDNMVWYLDQPHCTLDECLSYNYEVQNASEDAFRAIKHAKIN